MNLYTAVKWVWLAFGIFWLLGAFVQKRAVRRQSAGSRLLQVAIIVLALAPFYFTTEIFGVLHRPFLPNGRQFGGLGMLMLLLGLGFAVWARLVLGRNWSGTVTVKENHALITRGPYAYTRHPIYTGILFALLGTAIVKGTFAGLFAMTLATIALWLKLRVEERFMQETFGDQYTSYRQRVKALVPYVI